MKATDEQIELCRQRRGDIASDEDLAALAAVLSELATLREAVDAVEASDAVLSCEITERLAGIKNPQGHDETPLTEEWLHSIGFEDDRTGCPTLGPLHIQHAAITRMDSDVEYPAHACVRSFLIPVPKTRGDVRRLCRALGIALKETP